jgi:excisionase family DNA binding protein
MSLGNYVTLSELLGCSVSQVRKLVREGKIPAIRLGHKMVRFDLDQVRAALTKMTTDVNQ